MNRCMRDRERRRARRMQKLRGTARRRKRDASRTVQLLRPRQSRPHDAHRGDANARGMAAAADLAPSTPPTRRFFPATALSPAQYVQSTDGTWPRRSCSWSCWPRSAPGGHSPGCPSSGRAPGSRRGPFSDTSREWWTPRPSSRAARDSSPPSRSSRFGYGSPLASALRCMSTPTRAPVADPGAGRKRSLRALRGGEGCRSRLRSAARALGRVDRGEPTRGAAELRARRERRRQLMAAHSSSCCAR